MSLRYQNMKMNLNKLSLDVFAVTEYEDELE